MLARAEGPPQYTTEIPQVPNKTKPPKKSGKSGGDPSADASKNNGSGGTASGSETGGEGESSGGAGGQGSGNGGNGGSGDGAKNGGGDKGQSSQGNGSKSDGKPAVGENHQLTSNQSAADDGSSSPLVPILIAIAALAAISIAAVVIRNRRQGDGPDTGVSPKAS